MPKNNPTDPGKNNANEAFKFSVPDTDSMNKGVILENKSSSITKPTQAEEPVKTARIHQYADWSNVGSHSASNYEERVEMFNKYREQANILSKLSGEDLAHALKGMSDEEVMRTYYCSEAFQDRAYRMYGYKPGDPVPEKDLAIINKTINNGIREAIAGRVKYVNNMGNGNVVGNHTFLNSVIDNTKTQNSSKQGISLVGHEMAHGIYTARPYAISPGFNTFYTNDELRNFYGKDSAAINLLGTHGNDKNHDSAGIEQAADSSGLKVELTRKGIYNMFNSAPMTEEQFMSAKIMYHNNPLINEAGGDFKKGAKMVGDIASHDAHTLDDLQHAAKDVLASLNEVEGEPEESKQQSQISQHGKASTIASSNFEADSQNQENTRSRGLTV